LSSQANAGIGAEILESGNRPFEAKRFGINFSPPKQFFLIPAGLEVFL
jgi:hypothetical protein